MPAVATPKNNEATQSANGGEATTELILAIFRTNGRLLRYGDTLTKDIGLTSARWQVLGAIEVKPKTVAQIARDYELTRQGVLWVVQAMLKDGTVELIRNPDHRRAKLVQQTEEGRRVFAEITRRQKAWTDRLEQGFTAKELADALDVVRRLGDAVMPEEPDED